jgi:hypothetical protein
VTAPAHEGARLVLGGREWIVPPLTLRQLRRLQPMFATLGRIGPIMAVEQIDALIEITQAALSRNYPDITGDALADLIDLGNAAGVIRAIAGVSGLAPAGDASAGEASAGSASTGTN